MLRSIVKNSTIYVTVQVANAGIAFLLMPVLTRRLAPAEYGGVSVVLSLAAALTALLTLNLPSACVRLFFVDPNDENFRRKLWGTSFTYLLMTSVPFFLLACWFGYRFQHTILEGVPFYPTALIGFTLLIFAPVFDLYQSLLKLRHRAAEFAVQNILRLVVYMGSALILVLVFNLKGEGVLLANSIAALLAFVVTLIKFTPEVELGIDRPLLRKSLDYCLPFLPANMANWILASFDRIVLNKLKSTSYVGVYSIGAAIGSTMNMLTASFNDAFSPFFMATLSTEASTNVAQINRIAQLSLAFFCTVGLGLSLLSKEVIALLTPPAYHDAWRVVPYVVFTNILMALERLFRGPLDFSLRGGKFVSAVVIATSILHTLLLLVLIPRFGIVGVGMASLFSGGLTVAIYGWVAHWVKPFAWRYTVLIGIIALSAATCAATIVFLEAYQPGFEILYKLLITAAVGGLMLVGASGGIQQLGYDFTTARKLLTERFFGNKI